MAPSISAQKANVGKLYTAQQSLETEYQLAVSVMNATQAAALAVQEKFLQGKAPAAEMIAARTAADNAKKAFSGIVGRMGEAVGKTFAAQQEVLKAQTAGKSGLQLDGVDDAASLPVKEQIQLLGAPVAFNMSEAVKGDRARVSVAIKKETKNGATMLAFQLDGADPKYQSELIAKAKNHIETMADAANQSPEVAKELMGAISKTTGQARKDLIAIVADRLPATGGQMQAKLAMYGGGQFVEALRADLKSGKNFDIAADLIQGLKDADRPGEASDVVAITADGLQGLREDFEKRKSKVESLDAHLGRLVGGFGTALGETANKAGMDAFKAKHKGDYDKLDEASKKYLSALESADKFPALSDDTAAGIEKLRGMGMKPELSGENRLGDEVAKLKGKNFEPLMDTPEGKKKLEQALKDQLAGKPNWLNTLAKGGKNTKTEVDFLAKKLPNVITKGIGQLALSSANPVETSRKLLKNYQGVLNISDKSLAEFEKVAAELNMVNRTPKQVSETLDKLKSGDSPSLKKLGAILALPSALEALSKFGADQGLKDNFKALMGANDVLAALSDSKVLGMISKKLGPVAAGIAIGEGLGKLWDGEYLKGSSSVMSGVGTLLMAVPGGQLAGAVLTAASVVTGLLVESDERKAEKAAQADAETYLRGAGLNAETADAFSDLKQEDHRDIGAFLNQMAPRLKMTPTQLLVKLNELGKTDQDALEELADMVLGMPVNDDGVYAEKKQGFPYGDIGDTVMKGPNGMRFGPRSMDTAEQWMRAHVKLPD